MSVFILKLWVKETLGATNYLIKAKDCLCLTCEMSYEWGVWYRISWKTLCSFSFGVVKISCCYIQQMAACVLAGWVSAHIFKVPCHIDQQSNYSVNAFKVIHTGNFVFQCKNIIFTLKRHSLQLRISGELCHFIPRIQLYWKKENV